ncbi:MAG: hypothetical protein ACJ8AP_00530 [Gemmatimonadales bacterium]
MVYGMARHGIINPGFWVENNAEGLLLDVVSECRVGGHPSAVGQTLMERYRARIKRMLEIRR